MPNKPATQPAEPSFEHSLDELEQLVSRMEHGDLSLDDSLQSFEHGIALYRDCQGALDRAKLRVDQLLDPANPDAAQPFDEDRDEHP